MSQPCDLFEFTLFIMDRISSSLIFNVESRLSVPMVRCGKVLVFNNGVLFFYVGVVRSLKWMKHYPFYYSGIMILQNYHLILNFKNDYVKWSFLCRCSLGCIILKNFSGNWKGRSLVLFNICNKSDCGVCV